MAGTPLNYLQLTNRVLNRFNEVNLTSGNFGNAVGFQQAVKEGIIDAISDINTEELTWPFNHVSSTQLITVGTQFYSFPADYSVVDYDSFFLNRDDTLTPPVVGKPLQYITYNYWRKKLKDRDVALNSANFAPPDYVFLTQDNPNQWGISPLPNQAFHIFYEYYSAGPDMALYNDVPNVYPKYQSVIIDGATYYAYLFRDNAPEAAKMLEQFQAGIRQMRTELINRDDYMTNDVLPHGGGTARSYGYGFGF